MNNMVLDLFSGCGGLSLGFEMANYEVALGIDNWADALKTFEANHKNAQILLGDLQTLTAKYVAEKYNIKAVDVIVGGPPCQGFSIAGKREINDDRNKLYKNFVTFVSYFKPKAFVMENVPNIMSMDNGEVKKQIMADFEQLGYKISSKVMLSADYGVPQNRKRAVFVGLLNGKSFEFPPKTIENVITSFEAISDLPEMSVNDGEKYPIKANSEYQKMMRENSQKIHNHQITIQKGKENLLLYKHFVHIAL